MLPKTLSLIMYLSPAGTLMNMDAYLVNKPEAPTGTKLYTWMYSVFFKLLDHIWREGLFFPLHR